MNSITCLNTILIQIQNNSHLFENQRDLNNVASVLYKVGNSAMYKSFSCSLLKNVMVALKELHEKCNISDNEYKCFLRDVNNFYKSQNICSTYKLTLLSSFAPAVEIELLSLLKLCSNVSCADELHIIKSAVENSVLVQACQESEINIKKVTGILKKAFILSEGNPVVGYLTFCLFKSIGQSFYNPYVLPKELNFLDTYFHFPYHLLSNDDENLLIKRLVKSCLETINMNLCSKNDIIFYTALFPTCFRRIVNLCIRQTSNYIIDFLIFLSTDNNFEFCDWMNDINSVQENCLWKFLCD